MPGSSKAVSVAVALPAILAMSCAPATPVVPPPPVQSTGIDPKSLAWENSDKARLHGAGFAVAPGGNAIAAIFGRDLVEVHVLFGSEPISVHLFRSDDRALGEVAFSPNANWLAATEVEASDPVRIFVLMRADAMNPSAGDRVPGLFSVSHAPDFLGTLRFSADSCYLGTGSGPLMMWRTASGELAGENHAPSKLPEGLDGPTERTALGGLSVRRSEDKRRLTCTQNGKQTQLEPGAGILKHFGPINAYAVGAFDESGFCIWDSFTGKRMVRITDGPNGDVIITTRDGNCAFFPGDPADRISSKLPGKLNPSKVAATLADLLGRPKT